MMSSNRLCVRCSKVSWDFLSAWGDRPTVNRSMRVWRVPAAVTRLMVGPVLADYDERRIQRVLQNLIGNAIKYSPDGGSIEIEIRTSPTEARIAIRDHGIGIPAEARPHIFERGFRAHTVGVIPGTGLGLFISAEIVKRHGGTIACLAPQDGGTLIELHLPLARFGLAAEGGQQLPGHRAGRAGADRAVVDRDDRDRLARRAGEERFVGAE